MWPDGESSLMYACGGLLFVAVVWLALLPHAKRNRSLCLGPLGALLAAIVVATIRQAKHVPWVWAFPKAPLALWCLSYVLLGVGVAAAWRGPRPGRWVRVGCGASALCLNSWASAVFLWLATTSAAGV